MALTPSILIVVAALLQIPSPKLPQTVGGTHSQQDKQRAHDKQGESRDKPISIQPTETAPKHKATQDTEADAENNRQLTDYTGQLARYTRALIVVGILQFFALLVQAYFFNRSIKEMKDATTATREAVAAYREYVTVAAASNTITQGATELTRQSLILSQRPRITVRNIILDEPSSGDRFISRQADEEPFKIDVPIKGRLSVVNSGNGKATVIDSYCHVFNSGKPDELPMDLPYDAKAGTVLVVSGTDLAPGSMLECQFSGKGPSIDQIIEAKMFPGQDKLHMYVLGWIDYRDELGLTRRTAFCRRYNRDFDRFVNVNDADYEHAE